MSSAQTDKNGRPGQDSNLRLLPVDRADASAITLRRRKVESMNVFLSLLYVCIHATRIFKNQKFDWFFKCMF